MKGYRTKLSGYLASVLPVAGLLGIQVDADTVIHLLSNFGVPIGCAQLLASIAVHVYRNEAEPMATADLGKLELELEELTGDEQ